MEQIELTLKDCECKTAKNDKKYSLYDTSSGKIACWDTKVIEKLDTQLGNKILVEVSENNGFKTITNLMRVVEVNASEKQNATEVSIFSIEEAWSKKNPSTLYHKCKTNDGTMFVWNEEIAAKIKEEGINKVCLVKIEEKNNFKTIINFLEAKGEAKQEVKEDKPTIHNLDKPNNGAQAGMLTSYVKDIICTTIKDNSPERIDLKNLGVEITEIILETYKKIKKEL